MSEQPFHVALLYLIKTSLNLKELIEHGSPGGKDGLFSLPLQHRSLPQWLLTGVWSITAHEMGDGTCRMLPSRRWDMSFLINTCN